MAEYLVGDEGATVFDEHGRLLEYLRPGSVVVPGSIEENTAPRTPGQTYPMRRGYDDKVVRPERGPRRDG
jgi:hypothetical protein